MSRKNRPNKQKTMQKVAAPVIIMHQTPVTHGDVFATFLDEARNIGNEVSARRAHDAEIAEFLQVKGLTAEFEAFRAAKHQPKA